VLSIFEWPVRVYYEDTDAGGVVYYANYLKYLERARSEALRRLGVDQMALMRDSAIAFAVRRVEIDYLQPARLDDELTVEVVVESISRVSMTFRQRILRGPDVLLASALAQVVCVNTDRFRPTGIPVELLEKIKNAQQ